MTNSNIIEKEINFDVERHLNVLRNFVINTLDMVKSQSSNVFTFDVSEIIINKIKDFTPCYRNKHYNTKKETYSLLINTRINGVYNNLEIIAQNTNEIISFRFEPQANDILKFRTRGKLFRNDETNVELLKVFAGKIASSFQIKVDRFLSDKKEEEEANRITEKNLEEIINKSDNLLSGSGFSNVLNLKTPYDDKLDIRGLKKNNEWKFKMDLDGLSVEQMIEITKILNTVK